MNELTIKIRDIAEDQANPLALPLSRLFLADALAGMGADLAQTHATVDASLSKTEENVFVAGKLAGEIVLPCARCLKEARFPVDIPLHITIGPDLVDEDDSGELSGDESSDGEIEYFTHDGDVVRLGDIFREGLILTVPMSPLCRPDCAGLCPVCGSNRNEGACGCEPPHDPRWGALDALRVPGGRGAEGADLDG